MLWILGLFVFFSRVRSFVLGLFDDFLDLGYFAELLDVGKGEITGFCGFFESDGTGGFLDG